MTVSVAAQRIPSAPSDIPTVHVAAQADAAAWNAFVDASVEATAYHAWTWREVFERAFGHTCVYLIARTGGTIRGVLPLVQINSVLFGRTLTSLPFLNYGGVIARDAAAAEALLATAAEEARVRRCRHVELRHIGRMFPSLPLNDASIERPVAVQSAAYRTSADLTATFNGGPRRPSLWIVVPEASVVTRALSVPTGTPRRNTV